MLSKILIAILAITTAFNFVAGQSRCYNPNRNNGYCTSIYDCPPLLSLLRKVPLTSQDQKFLRESQCQNGAGRPPYVCCGEDSGYTSGTTTTSAPDRPIQQATTTAAPSNGRGNILPSPPQCGTEPAGNKIYNGNDTAIDEFPWLVLLEYRRGNSPKVLNCGGSLINQRYVVTAAHCVKGEIEREVGSLVSVRLGEYDISNDGIDCVEGDCTDEILIVGVEEVRVHENFVDSSLDRHNDIALIRLNRDVPYTGFIKPICLPSVLNLGQSAPNTELVVAGWGRTLLARQSSIKQKLSIPVADQNYCIEKFRARSVRIIDTQICAGGRFAEDSCDGDSGGPLMASTKNFWALIGIVSYGNRCGLEGWPAVYTRTSSFENWIRSNMRP